MPLVESRCPLSPQPPAAAAAAASSTPPPHPPSPNHAVPTELTMPHPAKGEGALSSPVLLQEITTSLISLVEITSCSLPHAVRSTVRFIQHGLPIYGVRDILQGLLLASVHVAPSCYALARSSSGSINHDGYMIQSQIKYPPRYPGHR